MAGAVSPHLRQRKQVLGEQRQRLLYEFNLLPAAYADPSWVEAIRMTDQTEPQTDHAECIEQSAALLQRHGLSEKFDWSVRAASVRLALLQNTAFTRICTALGLMCAAPRAKRIIDGASLRSLEDTFGDLYEAIWAPESVVLSRVGIDHSLTIQTQEDRLSQTRMAGYRAYKALLYADKEATPESISRALFRIPMSVAAEPVNPSDTAVGARVTHAVFRSAVKRWEPSWAWLF